MDFRLADASFEESKDAERDANELVIGVECAECGYQIWTQVRPGVETEVKCFRPCGGVTIVMAAVRSML